MESDGRRKYGKGWKGRKEWNVMGRNVMGKKRNEK